MSKEEDIIAVIDNVTGKKYTSLEDIISLVNLVYNMGNVWELKTLNLINLYSNRKKSNKGIRVQGDVYGAKISVLNELLNSMNIEKEESL